MLPERSQRLRGACHRCLRRSELLASLSPRIDHSARDLERVRELLALEDERLIQALGGRRREQLFAQHRRFEASRCRPAPRAVCPHVPGFSRLPTLLHVAGELEGLRRALREPLVAIVGSERPTAYGRAVAAQLAAELASAGIVVTTLLSEGIAASALAAALGGGAAPLAIAASGLAACHPVHLDGLRRRVSAARCAVSQLPPQTPQRRWSKRSAALVILTLSSLLIVVEGEDERLELQLGRLARRQGRIVGAVPGRIGGRGVNAPHALLRDGAPLVSGAQDVLDLLYGSGRVQVPSRAETLPPHLASVLDRVGGGDDTLERLLTGPNPAATLLAVGELEARSLLVRGAGGRYHARLAQPPRNAAAQAPSAGPAQHHVNG
jgi:DNA processing protein